MKEIPGMRILKVVILLAVGVLLASFSLLG
jgi:hypothetical protein